MALAPRATLALHSKQLQHRLLAPTIRHSSTKPPPPPKPRVLAKPERFNPPSHPSRIRAKPKYYGPELSTTERQAQRKRQYPHMMPPEGTFLFWFLTNRKIHMYISLSVLVSLAFGIWYQDFIHNTPYVELLPPKSMFFAHPVTFFGRWWEVYKMHVEHVSAETAERRRQKTEDVQRRSEYRKAHGIEDKAESVFGSWTPSGEVTTHNPAFREGGSLDPSIVSPAAVNVAQGAVGGISGKEGETYVDFEGKTQSVRTKWFGIW